MEHKTKKKEEKKGKMWGSRKRGDAILKRESFTLHKLVE